MTEIQTCKTCGSPLAQGATICSVCKTPVGGASLPNLGTGNYGLPSLPLNFLGGLTPGADLIIGEMPAMPKPLDLGKVGLDFAAGKVAQGRPYKPLFVAGRVEQDQPELRMPFSILACTDGNFMVMNYYDEAGHSRVSLYDHTGKLVKVVVEFETGTADQALDTPSNIAEDAAGNLLVVDLGASCIKKFSPNGHWLATFGSEGEGRQQITSPRDLAVDAQSNIYIADSGNNRILKWDQTGHCLLVMGFEAETTEGYLEPGEEPGQLDEPLSLSVDAEGCTWVADTNNHRIQKFDAQGGFASSFGQQGEIAGQFNYPSNIRLDRQGNIYVADCDGERIQKFDPTGCFIYQIYLPPDTGRLEDFDVDPSGILLIALRKANLVLGLEVQ